MSHDVAYGYTKELKGVGFDDAIARTTEALKTEGFGVLTTIDVRDTLKKKIGADFRPYVILGACNPHLAHRGLSQEPGLGLLLPCNVTVSQEADAVVVQVIKPEAMFSVVHKPGLEGLVREADEKLRRALEKV